MSKVARFIVPVTTLAALLALVMTLAPTFAGAAAAKPAPTLETHQPFFSQLSSITSLGDAAASMTKTAVVVSLLFVWIVAAIVVTLFAGREVRFSSVEVRASALYCFALGLVAFTSFVITAIVFSYLVPYIVGVPLLVALGVFAILTKVYGMISVFHAVGSLVAGSRTRSQLARRRWLRGDLAMVIVGVVLLGAIRLIPVVGTIIWTCASVFGIGTALATRFGRREPAFLAWRPAEA
jgi:hypothetical protein